jgi:hypothetical protein
MTSLLGTNHLRMENRAGLRPSNSPVCRNPAIVYPPSQLTSFMQDGKWVLEGSWEFGISGEDSCSPVKLKVTFDGSQAQLEATRVDNFSGIEEPVRLKPSMINGMVASLAEHFDYESDAEFEGSKGPQLNPKILQDRVGCRVPGLVDSRFEEPLAPCVPVLAETVVELSSRALGRSGW